jgi:2-polyprenyl-3-methyl-5-hydroxy-6-metoxy-1,4-benzoquinol methylase
MCIKEKILKSNENSKFNFMKVCPICSSTSTYIKFKLTFPVYQCRICSFQFCPDATFDKSFKSDLNEETREKALKQVRKENFQKIVASIKEYGNLNPKGLEVGCGYGWFLETCKENALDCEGIEPETRFNEAYKNNGFNVINGFYPGDLAGNIKYDFIIFNDVFEHLPDVRSILKANYSLLNTNGLLIINLPIQGGLVYFFSKLAYHLGILSLLNRMWQFNFHSPHLSYFGKNNLVEFVTSNNFQLTEKFKLKTLNLSEISDRIKQDKKQSIVMYFITYVGVLILYPFFQLFPDTFCFVFKKI